MIYGWLFFSPLTVTTAYIYRGSWSFSLYFIFFVVIPGLVLCLLFPQTCFAVRHHLSRQTSAWARVCGTRHLGRDSKTWLSSPRLLIRTLPDDARSIYRTNNKPTGGPKCLQPVPPEQNPKLFRVCVCCVGIVGLKSAWKNTCSTLTLFALARWAGGVIHSNPEFPPFSFKTANMRLMPSSGSASRRELSRR